MLESLHLRNFRRFESVDVTFSKGLNGIFGKNYQGKSTLLLAIGVAIGAPGWARGLRLARRGQEKFEVQLVFKAGEHRYRVMRSQSSGSLERLIGKGEDKLIASGQTQVNIELGKILGMPVERWLELRFVRQKAASTMFSSGSTKLNLLVEDLTGARTVTQVIELLGVESKKLEAKLETLRGTRLSDEQLESLQGQLKNAVAEHEELKTAMAGDAELLAGLQATLTGLSNQVQAKAAEHKTLQSQLRKAEGLRSDLAACERSLASLPPADESSAAELANKIEISEALLKEDQQLLRDLADARKDQKRVVDSAAQAFADKTWAEDELKEKPLPDETLDQYEADSETFTTELATVTAETQAKGRKQDELMEQLESGVCKSCGQRTDKGEDHTEHLQAEIAELERQITALTVKGQEIQAKHADLKTRGKALRAQVDAHNDAQRALAVRAEAFTKKQAEAETASEAVKALEDKLPKGGDKKLAEMVERGTAVLSEKRERHSTQKQRERDLARLEPQLNSIKGELELFGDDLTEEAVTALADTLDGLRRDERQAELKLNTAQSAATNRRTAMAGVERVMLNLTERLEQQQDLLAELDRLDDQQLNAEGLRKYLRDNRSRYLQNAWDLILGRASAFAEGVTDGHITEIRRTEEGTFQYIEEGEVALADMASGAQEAILGIGVQVALAETLPTSLDVFLADEPTADMDADHSSACLLGLSSVSSQALVISHHRMDESICSEVMEL